MDEALTVTGHQELAGRPTLGHLVALFIAEQDITEASRATYTRSLRQFTTWLEETGRLSRLSELQRNDILEFKQSLVDAGRSAYTVSSYLTVARKLYAWLESKKLYPNIGRDIKGAKKPRGHRKDCLSEEQLRLVMSAMDAGSLEGARDFGIFNLVARTGLRTIEVARANVGDIRREAGQAVLWIQGKGRDAKDDFVVLTEKAETHLRVYLRMRQSLSFRHSVPKTSSGKHPEPQLPADAPLFCSHSDRNAGQRLTPRSISRLIKQALRRAGLDDIRLSAHSLRHTAITLAVKGGASLEQAQAMARHSDPATTMVYFHNLERVRDAAERHINF